MMSPRPPPIYPRSSLPPSSSTMAESPRPMASATFQSHHQLPPPIFNDTPGQAPRFSGPGPTLPPLAISDPSVSTLPQPPVQQSKQLSHIPQPQHSQQHISTSSQTPHKREVRPVSAAPYGSIITRETSYNSPTNSGISSPNTYNFYDDRRYSQDSDRERRRSSLSTMVPSPTYNPKRSVDFPGDQQQHQQHQQQQPNYPSSRYTPTPLEDVVSRRPSRPQSSPGRYTIQVRQQPIAARACGFGERDRRVIDPPPIVQLIVNDPTGHSDPNEMRYPFNVVHCTLWNENGNMDETALINPGDKRLTRRLMGTLVSSPFVGQDEEGKEGCFFCFPDLSCRTHGSYRLRFVLMRLEPSDLPPDGYTPIITEAMSDVFIVYTAKEFPGMRPSTELTKALKLQGCAISVKKGNEKAIGAAGGSGKEGDSDNDNASPSTAASKPKRRRKE